MVDDLYFHDIDTEAKAYLVGFLLADGCINKTSSGEYKVVQLHISTKDIEIVELIQSETKNTRKVYIDPKFTRCAFRATSRQMVCDLAKFGIVPRKTGREVPNFASVPKYLLRHTVRGLIDGDGWLSISNTSTGRLVTSVGICGSYCTCEYFTKYMHNELGLGLLTPSKVLGKDCYKVGYSSLEDGKKIINHLYNNSSVMLSRKYERALKIISL